FYLLFMSNQYTSLVILHLLDDSQTYISIAKYFLGVNVAGADDLLLAGPGYGFLLAMIFKLFGFTSWPILILQVLASSFGCVYIYKICQILLDNRKISLIASFLAVTSLTSISLSAAILSDTVFFFLLVLAIYYFLIASRNGGWKYFIISGIILGISTLLRSVGLFFPIILLIIALVSPLKSSILSRKSVLLRSVVTGLILIIVALPWAIKNNNEHQIFTVSETGTLAARNYLCSRVIFNAESRESLIELRDWMAAPKTVQGRQETARERHEHATLVIKEAFSRYPGSFITTFLQNIFENIGALSTIHSLQLPQFRNLFNIYTENIFTKGNSLLVFFLSLIGFVLLLWENKKREAIILASIYCYFAFLSGFTYWQGSRIFYPGQLAWTIFVAITLYQIYLAITKFINYQKLKQSSKI
ncbi:MAG: glycosyltransferase family 39 protein, partial [candidate division Zixibacteria bacterium]|nr:glycosyltransferase family 39 protein [candidate division Zixibacteria bacterium]